MFRGVSGLFRRSFRDFERGLVNFTRWVGYLLFRGFMGTWGWARTRSWSYLLQGFPAIVAVILVCAAVGLRAAMPAVQLESFYRDESKTADEIGKKALDSKNDPEAKKQYQRIILCQERLVQLGDSDPKAQYYYALAMDALGRPDRAMQVMRQIAKDNIEGYSEAHLWRAQRHLMSNDPGQREFVREQCALALKRTGALPDHGIPARVVLADSWFREGAEAQLKGDKERADECFENAVTEFKVIVEKWAHLYLRYAQVLRLLNRNAEADDAARQAEKYFQTRVRANSKDALARTGLADSHAFRRQFKEAIKTLKADPHEGAKRDTNFDHSLAQTYLAWHLDVLKEKPDDIGMQLDLIGLGLDAEPKNPYLLERMLSYMQKEGKELDKASKILAKHIAEKGETPLTLFLRGMIFLAKKENATSEEQKKQNGLAEQQFERAFQLGRDFPILCNNFAWVLANKENVRKEELAKAHECLNIALSRSPTDPSYLDTRATLFIREEKWNEALGDLMFIVRQVPDFRGLQNVHARLSLVYDKLGDKESADEHRALTLKMNDRK